MPIFLLLCWLDKTSRTARWLWCVTPNRKFKECRNILKYFHFAPTPLAWRSEQLKESCFVKISALKKMWQSHCSTAEISENMWQEISWQREYCTFHRCDTFEASKVKDAGVLAWMSQRISTRETHHRYLVQRSENLLKWKGKRNVDDRREISEIIKMINLKFSTRVHKERSRQIITQNYSNFPPQDTRLDQSEISQAWPTM